MRNLLIILAILANGCHSSNDSSPKSVGGVYACHLDKDFDDWRIDINLAKKTADFFDNNTTVTLSLTSSRFIGESLHQVHEFSGEEGETTLSFDQSREKATLTINVGTEDEKALAFSCEGGHGPVVAQGDATAYECSLEKDFDDWRLSIDLTHGVVSFFDNDHDTKLTFVETLQVGESTVHKFAGRDFFSNQQVEVEFDQTKGKAQLTDNAGATEEVYKFNCRASE